MINTSREEIYIIIDCCHASGMKLNYQLDKNEKGKFIHIEKLNTLIKEDENKEVEIVDLVSSLKKQKQQEHNIEGDNYKQQVIIIASSQQNEKAAAIKHTSLFTKYFIEFLDHYDTRLFVSMVSYIDDNLYSYSSNKQQVNVYSSKMIIPMISTYMFVPRHIKINYQYSYLEISDVKTIETDDN